MPGHARQFVLLGVPGLASLARDDTRGRRRASRRFGRDGRRASPSTSRRLHAVAGALDLLEQHVDADRADDHLPRRDIGRRAGQRQLGGELIDLGEGGADLVRLHLRLELFDIDADFPGNRDRPLAVYLPALAEQGVVEGEVFVRRDDVEGDPDLRRLDRSLAEHREFLEHDPEVLIAGEQLLQVAMGAPAVGAVVVEELDQRDVAVGIAEDHLPLRAEEQVLVVGDRLDLGHLLGGILPALQFGERVTDDFRVGEEIAPDDRLDLGPLVVAQFSGQRLGERRSRLGWSDRSRFWRSRSRLRSDRGCLRGVAARPRPGDITGETAGDGDQDDKEGDQASIHGSLRCGSLPRGLAVYMTRFRRREASPEQPSSI